MSKCGALMEQHLARYLGQPSSDPPHKSRCSAMYYSCCDVFVSLVLSCVVFVCLVLYSSVAPKDSKGHRRIRPCYYRQACTQKMATNPHRPRSPECRTNTGHHQGRGEPGYPDCSTLSKCGAPASDARIPRLCNLPGPRSRCTRIPRLCNLPDPKSRCTRIPRLCNLLKVSGQSRGRQ